MSPLLLLLALPFGFGSAILIVGLASHPKQAKTTPRTFDQTVEMWEERTEHSSYPVPFLVNLVVKTITPLKDYSAQSLKAEEQQEVDSLVKVASELVGTIAGTPAMIARRSDFRATVEAQLTELEKAVRHLTSKKDSDGRSALSEADMLRQLKQDTDFLRHKFPTTKTTGALR